MCVVDCALEYCADEQCTFRLFDDREINESTEGKIQQQDPVDARQPHECGIHFEIRFQFMCICTQQRSTQQYTHYHNNRKCDLSIYQCEILMRMTKSETIADIIEKYGNRTPTTAMMTTTTMTTSERGYDEC